MSKLFLVHCDHCKMKTPQVDATCNWFCQNCYQNNPFDLREQEEIDFTTLQGQLVLQRTYIRQLERRIQSLEARVGDAVVLRSNNEAFDIGTATTTWPDSLYFRMGAVPSFSTT